MARPDSPRTKTRRKSGFARAASLVEDRIASAGQSRGFAVSRLLTHWAEIAGPEVASRAQPVKIVYGRGSLGATLTLLTKGADAPLVQMQSARIIAAVNAAYGYAAVRAIRLTQTAPMGFSEAQAEFEGVRPNVAPLSDTAREKLRDMASGVTDPKLREALEGLALNVMTRQE